MLQTLLDLSFGGLALGAGGFFVLYFIIDFIRDPLRDIPGPLLARFTRWWYFIEIYKGSFELTNVELHKKYGPIVRIAPHEYSIDDVEAAKTIYGHGNAFVKVCVPMASCFLTKSLTDFEEPVVLGLDAPGSFKSVLVFRPQPDTTQLPTSKIREFVFHELFSWIRGFCQQLLQSPYSAFQRNCRFTQDNRPPTLAAMLCL